jgi:hypothetical protein
MIDITTLIPIPVEVSDNRVGGIDILGSWMEIGMVLAAIIVGGLLIWPTLKNLVFPRKHFMMSGFNKFRTMHTRIQEILTELRVKSDADRALIIRFHNGGKFLDGSSIKKFSLTHESCSIGISETRNSRQDILISTFIEMLDHVIHEQQVVIVEPTNDLPDCHFKRHLEANHTLAYSLVPIKDTRGVLILGCLLVEWCNWDKVDRIDDDQIMVDIPSYAGYIESQLLEEVR